MQNVRNFHKINFLMQIFQKRSYRETSAYYFVYWYCKTHATPDPLFCIHFTPLFVFKPTCQSQIMIYMPRALCILQNSFDHLIKLDCVESFENIILLLEHMTYILK